MPDCVPRGSDALTITPLFSFSDPPVTYGQIHTRIQLNRYPYFSNNASSSSPEESIALSANSLEEKAKDLITLARSIKSEVRAVQNTLGDNFRCDSCRRSESVLQEIRSTILDSGLNVPTDRSLSAMVSIICGLAKGYRDDLQNLQGEVEMLRDIVNNDIRSNNPNPQ